MRTLSAASLLVIALLNAGIAMGQAPYPTKPIRLIVPFPAGGPNDVLGRIVAERMGSQLGQQVVVDNRGGANGIIAGEFATNAAPDGHTLLLGGTGVLAINPGLHPKLPYDPVKGFAPISMVADAPSVIVVHPSSPVRTVPDLISLAKAKPGQLTFGAGTGSAPQLAVELFKIMAGVDMLHVPYKGGGLVVIDLMANQISLYFSVIPTALPLIQGDRLRAIAVTSAKRTDILPHLPTVAETLPGYEFTTWFAMLAPPATPPAIINKLHGVVVKTLAAPEVRKRFVELGADPVTSTPAELGAFTRSEVVKMAKVIKFARIEIN
jgi:tripartite-type tricarboxylate transporter receptor subunit TctC